MFNLSGSTGRIIEISDFSWSRKSDLLESERLLKYVVPSGVSLIDPKYGPKIILFD